jgi:hypothetical protein
MQLVSSPENECVQVIATTSTNFSTLQAALNRLSMYMYYNIEQGPEYINSEGTQPWMWLRGKLDEIISIFLLPRFTVLFFRYRERGP